MQMLCHLHQVCVVLMTFRVTLLQVLLILLREILKVQETHIARGVLVDVPELCTRDLGDAVLDVMSDLREHLLVESDGVHFRVCCFELWLL
ncbi:hypothetical protein PBCV1_a132R [Paramecium bursaria Chlorella virus 1]|uniref:Uncharacterized protein n=1 Tax=Paramecium bursaria Chlorella virus 1 TaxID=10506 RepID=Q84452_PBCV1|nr:hypothetical protein PBCV1_a132R [Paramecium bursaria Chlorella virus 1]AAC96500.1 hypothetical protein [Paramecium bursaria Chlorella virus 1]